MAMDGAGCLAEAKALDARDALSQFRKEFALPANKVYLCGNSLGPMPSSLFTRLPQELTKWAEQGVEGHFTEPNPWVSVNETCVSSMARLVGAKPSEIAIMNSLTVNLHLLLTSFYRPDLSKQGRVKILMERNAFPSDLYCIASHVRSRGLDPDVVVVLSDDVERDLETQSADLALCFLGGVNYQTGEVYDMGKIAKLCRARGITLGLDLAHAAGNVQLELHAWDVDFAAWCTYKYLNSGPGGIAAAFVHERHHHYSRQLKRLEGWWGNASATRFEMKSKFEPATGASAWQLSNPPVLQIVSLRASLDVLDRVDLGDMFAKSRALTAFLESCLHTLLPKQEWSTLTPPPPRRGCQLSLVFPNLPVRQVFDELAREGMVCDFREPNIIRVAANPVYNSFTDVARFALALKQVVAKFKSRI